MFARINSLGVYALNGFSVSVEADISGGLPQFTIVGLPDSAVREATDRVRSALKNLSFVWPVSRITVNLAPGDIRKTGPVYDLPVLLAILAASGQDREREISLTPSNSSMCLGYRRHVRHRLSPPRLWYISHRLSSVRQAHRRFAS